MVQTVLITGATSGIGRACARKYGNAGYRLVLTGRRMDRLSALQKELSGPIDVQAIAMDVRNRDAVTTAIESLAPDFRDIDILINNAGLALGFSTADQADPEDWDIMVDTNIKGVLYLTSAVLPGMVRRNRGHIVNMGSVAGSFPYPCGNVYGASKAFVEHFSRNLRSDLLGKSIRVTNIEPGLAQTEFSMVRFKGDTETAEAAYRGVKPLAAEDMADMIFWVTSLPDHVNINRLEVMPVCEAWGPLAFHRE